MLASGADSATALARSRTIEALVLKRSVNNEHAYRAKSRVLKDVDLSYHLGSCQAFSGHQLGSRRLRHQKELP